MIAIHHNGSLAQRRQLASPDMQLAAQRPAGRILHTHIAIGAAPHQIKLSQTLLTIQAFETVPTPVHQVDPHRSLRRPAYRFHALGPQAALALRMFSGGLDALDLGPGLEVLLEPAVELAEGLVPVELAFADPVELRLHLRRELHFHDVREVLDQPVRDEHPQLGGHELALVLDDVHPVLDGGDDRGVGRRATNTIFFQGLNQAGLRKTRRRLGEFLLCVEFEQV